MATSDLVVITNEAARLSCPMLLRNDGAGRFPTRIRAILDDTSLIDLNSNGPHRRNIPPPGLRM